MSFTRGIRDNVTASSVSRHAASTGSAEFFAPLAAPMNASLLYAVAYVLLNFGIAVVLHRRGWYLRA